MKAAILKEVNNYPIIDDVNLDPDEHKVIVPVLASALNHRDLWICKGQYPGIKYPIILGSDGVGVHKGQEVLFNPGLDWGKLQSHQQDEFTVLGLPDNGTFAEEICIDEKNIYPKPEHLTNEQAAALPLSGVTAYRALINRAKAKKGEKVLITGIGGGVALFALQFALANENEVYVTSGSDEKIARAIELGAKGGVNYKEENWHKKLHKMAGSFFDVIIDSAGGDGFSQLVKIAAPGGRVALYGGTVGNYNNLSPQIIFWRQLSILGSTMGSKKDFEDMLDFVALNDIVPIIDQVFKLENIAGALDRMDSGKQFGKIVLTH